tara:strand:- start:2140 stop:3441 length:1302 start_codon:yes stop_codon:yes gene_type:complete
MFSLASGLALIFFAILQWPKVILAYRVFAVLALTLGLTLWFNNAVTAETIAEGVDRAAFFTFFLTSLAVLRESAKTSQLIRRCGTVLVNQPPGRRYILMSFGSHLFSIMLNVGALNVLGTMIRKAIRPSPDPSAQRIGAIRRKRMLTATCRGFCGVPIWAPTSVTMLLVLTGIPDLEWEQYAPFGLLWTLLFILWGWVLDRLAYKKPRAQTVNGGNLSLLIPLIGLVTLIPSLAFITSKFTGQSMFSTLLICAPVIGLAWIWGQYRGKPTRIKRGLLLRRITRSFPHTFNNQRNEVILFVTSGFIGVTLIPLIDPVVASNYLTQENISNATLMISISIMIILLGFIGINPILSVTLILGALQQIPDLNIPPLLQASVIAITWAIFAGTSPFTVSLRFISEFSGVSPLRFGIEWNRWFNISVLAIMYLTLYVML